MAAHSSLFPSPDEKPKPPRVRNGSRLKDPFWWAAGGILAMLLALGFVVSVA